MSISKQSIVYSDSRRNENIVSATGGGPGVPIISVTHGATFDGDVSNGGRTLSVPIERDDIRGVLAELGNRLRGLSETDRDRTVVTSEYELTMLIADISGDPTARAAMQMLAGWIVRRTAQSTPL